MGVLSPPAADAVRRLDLLAGFAASAHNHAIALTMPAQRVLACLALQGRSSRSGLAGRLWPEATQVQALANLRTVLWKMRDAARWLQSTAGGVALADDVAVDVHVLDRLARASRPLGTAAAAPTLTELMRVLELPVAELLPDWPEDWVELERERLRQVHVRALCTLGRALAVAGDAGQALDAAHLALSLDPLRESSHRLLVEIHLQEGDYAAAQRCYESYRRQLLHELGVLPSPQMRDLVGRIPRARIMPTPRATAH